LAGESEVLGENLPHRHFVHHKSHMTRPGLEPRAAAVGSQRLGWIKYLTAFAHERRPCQTEFRRAEVLIPKYSFIPKVGLKST
jgi:hypothetical protein